MLAALLGLLWWTNRPPLHEGTMLFANDGDSFAIGSEGHPRHLRLAGIDAPELHQSCGEPRNAAWACGRAARDALKALAPRGTILSCRTRGEDDFGRTLSRCRLADGRDLAAPLVAGGWAMATNEDYLVEEGRARRAKAGVWRGDFQSPAEWRAANPRSNRAIPLPSPTRVAIPPV